MALAELISLEKIICVSSKVNLRATYEIFNMKLSTLFREVITEVEKGFLPILEMKILLYTLKDVVFSYDSEGDKILCELRNCINQELYGSDDQWPCDIILGKLNILYNLIAHDIIINGSLIWNMNEKIEWELYPPFCIPLERRV